MLTSEIQHEDGNRKQDEEPRPDRTRWSKLFKNHSHTGYKLSDPKESVHKSFL